MIVFIVISPLVEGSGLSTRVPRKKFSTSDWSLRFIAPGMWPPPPPIPPENMPPQFGFPPKPASSKGKDKDKGWNTNVDPAFQKRVSDKGSKKGRESEKGARYLL